MEYNYEHITKEEFEIEKMAESLSYQQQGLFLLMTTERMFAVYKQYAQGKEWNRTEKLNAMLEDCWNSMVNDVTADYIMDRAKAILDESEDEDKFLYECMDDCPHCIMGLDKSDEEIPDEMEILMNIVIYIHKLLRQTAVISILKQKENVKKELVVGIFNFPFLEEFLCYYSPEFLEAKENDDDTLFQQHELVRLELEREKRDFAYLKSEKNMQKIYQRYHFELQENILGDYWFEEEAQQKDEPKECDEEEDTVDFYYIQGCLYASLDRYEQAVQFFSKAIALEPDYVQAYDTRGYAYMQLQRYQEAIFDYHKIIELNPNYERAYHCLGGVYETLQDYKKAISYYKKALELDDTLEASYYHLGRIYNLLKKYQKAIVYYSKLLELNPKAEVAYFGRANSYDALRKHQKAVEDLTKAIELKSDYLDAYYNRADSYDKLKEYQKAIDDLSRFLEIYPEFARAYCKRGGIYCKVKEYQKAIDDYSAAIALDPNDKETYLNRAKVYRAIGEKEKAVADKNRAKEID